MLIIHHPKEKVNIVDHPYVLYHLSVDADQKNYELAYILSSSIPEGEILVAAGKLSALIEEAKGIVKRVEAPKKRRLAYPIKKESNGYFGWTTFRMAPEGMATLEKKIKGEKNLLRHVIVEEEIETRQPFVRPMTPRRAPTMQKAATIQMSAEEAPEEKLDLEALDKKLEEILGK